MFQTWLKQLIFIQKCSIRLLPRFARATPTLPDEHAEYQHLNHLGVELETAAQVESSIERFEQLGLVDSVEKDTTCCYAVQDKVWMQSPDGAPWEYYTVLADAPTYYATTDQKCC